MPLTITPTGATLGAIVTGVALANLTPSFPYWGDLATTFAWNMESLPGDGVNALGPGVANDLRPLIAVIDDTLPDAKTAAAQPLLTLAKRKSLAAAVDLVATLVGLEFGETNALSRIVYGLGGLSAIYQVARLATARRRPLGAATTA